MLWWLEVPDGEGIKPSEFGLFPLPQRVACCLPPGSPCPSWPSTVGSGPQVEVNLVPSEGP